MNEPQFDTWTRTLAAGQTRRTILRRLVGSLVGAFAATRGWTAAEADHKGEDHGKPDDAGKPQGRCPDGFTNCRGRCVILEADENNCGACAVVCPAGWDCCHGACTDPASFQDDSDNCGACGNACAEGQSCCSAACVDTNTDLTNCGGCGTTCAADQTCSAGVCLHCGLPEEPCCPPDNSCVGDPICVACIEDVCVNAC